MSTTMKVGAKPIHLAADQTLTNSAGDDLVYATVRADIEGEGFDPNNLPRIGVGESLDVTFPVFVRTETWQGQATALLLTPEDSPDA